MADQIIPAHWLKFPKFDPVWRGKCDPQPGLERHTVPRTPEESFEENSMFPEDLLLQLGHTPLPEVVYVLCTQTQQHAVARRPDPLCAQTEIIGLVTYPSAGKALAACNSEKHKAKNYSPAALQFDAAVELALSKRPTLDCILLLRDPQDPLIHYVR